MFSPHASRGRRLGRSVALAVPLLLLPLALAPAATAADKPALPVGLFGQQDPTFDGVYRQSLSLLAYAIEGVEPPAESIAWLLDQQCDNGGFEAFRADPSNACASPDPATFSGPDTNATAMAAQALLALGEDAGLDAVDYLESTQNSDGGIPTYAGGATDANSTGLTAMALSAAGIDPEGATASSGKSLTDALDALQVGCKSVADEQGAFAFQDSDPLAANDYATVQALIGRAGASLPLLSDRAAKTSSPRLDCGTGGTSDPTVAGAGYLAARLDANGGTIPDAFNPGGTDWGSTRFAVMALASAESGRGALIAAFEQLAENQDGYLSDDQSDDRPGALAELILATNAALPSLEAAGVEISSVKRQTVVLGVDTTSLLDRLGATLTPAPETTATPEAESGGTIPATDTNAGGTELADTGVTTTTSAALAAVLIGLGIAMVAGSRRRWDMQE